MKALGSDAPRLPVADAPTMRPVVELIRRVGPSDANILITGENGTGKGLVAHALHAFSPRATKPLSAINMDGLSGEVFESQLFGHVKGAFTDAKTDRVGWFELTEAGTLFLDELANIPLKLQTALLHVLETGEFKRAGSSKTSWAEVRPIEGGPRGGVALLVTNGLRRRGKCGESNPCIRLVQPLHHDTAIGPPSRAGAGRRCICEGGCLVTHDFAL